MQLILNQKYRLVLISFASLRLVLLGQPVVDQDELLAPGPWPFLRCQS